MKEKQLKKVGQLLMMVELLCNREEKKEMIFFIDREPHLS
jgi:hypothetical protein